MEPLTCTKREFIDKVIAVNRRISKAFAEMPIEEAMLFQESEYRKLMKYEVLNGFEPYHHNKDLLAFIKKYCDEQITDRDRKCVTYKGSLKGFVELDDWGSAKNIPIPEGFSDRDSGTFFSGAYHVKGTDYVIITISGYYLEVSIYCNDHAFNVALSEIKERYCYC